MIARFHLVRKADPESRVGEGAVFTSGQVAAQRNGATYGSVHRSIDSVLAAFQDCDVEWIDAPPENIGQ